jgi:putative restriction endonuclease
MSERDPDHELRVAAVGRAVELIDAYNDLVPVERLREGFRFRGERVSFGSFQKGIHRSQAQRGPAALTLTTSFKDPYGDELGPGGGFVYAYRAGSPEQADNRALRAAHALLAPIVYFRALAPGQYWVVAPVFVAADDPAARAVVLEAGDPVRDMGASGLESSADVRAYATTVARRRLHQQRFRIDVLRAYRSRCAVCALRERSLVDAAHIVADIEPEGIAAVVNGIALCAIHHQAFDRNLLGIDPAGIVHIASRLLREHDGPMLREGLQGFHGRSMELPRRREERPDQRLLGQRFERFAKAAA